MMTAILAVAGGAAGLAMIVGARETAKKIGLTIIAIIVGMAFCCVLLCWVSAVWSPSDPTESSVGWFWPLVATSAMAVGGIAWKTRAWRQRRRDDLRRRQMHPRRPAPLPPPNDSSSYDEGVF